MKFIINGDFLCRNLTGIERFAYEICNRLDALVESSSVGIFVPANARVVPEYKNIQVFVSEKTLVSFPRWIQFVYGKFLKKHKATGIDFSNNCPIGNAGVVFVHDIYCKLYPNDFTSFRDKLVRAYSCLMYRYASRHAKLLLTVSHFSQNQIATTYKIRPEKIHVVPNGWEHFQKVVADTSIFQQFPQLEKDFYFTLGSLSRRKNLLWIANYAEQHPQDTFAISGKMLSGLVPPELERLQTLPNIVLLGYVTDGEVKALMERCKAFVLPSYYEGFGIPPLEALSCGTKIVVARAASLPEIYGEAAHYIDPDNSNVDLEELLSQPVADAKPVLEKYTYDNAAHQLYELLKEFI